MNRILLLVIACGIGAVPAHAAETYPNKPIRLIVPFPPGAASDFLARTLGQKLNELYGQQIVIDNRPGAGGIVGSTLVVKSAPDGYTLGMVGQPHLMQPLLQKSPPYRPLDEIVTITQVATLPNVLVVSPQLPVKTVSDVIALAKS